MVKPARFIGANVCCQRAQWRDITLLPVPARKSARSGGSSEGEGPEGKKKEQESGEREEDPLANERSPGRKRKIARESSRQSRGIHAYYVCREKKETEGKLMVRSQVSGLFKGATGIRESLRVAVKWARSVVWHWSARYTQCV